MLFGAVLGSFVIGMGSQEPATQAPAVNLEFEADEDGTVTITHDGGEALERAEIEIRTPGTVGEWPGPELYAGEEITVTGLESGDEITVVWHSPDGDGAAVIAVYDVE
ncbi:conserved hypothetical protein (DUF1628) [Halorhabdus tiamatea SARL4B]|nr:conserved hypothetical protein (DUF1628) [Halorhabdus tiamatea SARL4B]